MPHIENPSPKKDTLIYQAAENINVILDQAIQYTPSTHSAVVIADARSSLAKILTAAYSRCLPHATFVDFDHTTPEKISALFETLKPSDLTVLIQSSSFRLNAFRLRVELFQKSIKVIEHPHLERMQGIEQQYYIDSLAYDPGYFRGVGNALKEKIDSAQSGVVVSGNECLKFDSPFETAKLNTGDYSNMKNIGGQYPIGEVFTEAQDLEKVNGRAKIFAFGDTSFSVNKPNIPITIIVNNGRVTDVINSTPEFDAVLENIRKDEGEVWLRELGFGLNKAFSPERIVKDIGTYERMCGIHLSLGAKHAVYKKPNFKRNNTWHHVDVFVATESVLLDNSIVFSNGQWRV